MPGYKLTGMDIDKGTKKPKNWPHKIAVHAAQFYLAQISSQPITNVSLCINVSAKLVMKGVSRNGENDINEHHMQHK